ncbi:MAG TPA: CarD family transcriptional regulator, partial [Thermohalobaculum sp.]|nr:CarD family transcriptional regulator [Thermohalobaculum sp.]
QSYSERQLYEAARERLTREVAAVERLDDVRAAAKVAAVLQAKAA